MLSATNAPGLPVVARPSAASAACENGRHSALPASRRAIGALVHAECRHCGCPLTRMAASRRWFRSGQMG